MARTVARIVRNSMVQSSVSVSLFFKRFPRCRSSEDQEGSKNAQQSNDDCEDAEDAK